MDDYKFIDITERQPVTDKSVIGTHPELTPIDILNSYGYEDFELFILEWASSFLQKGYHVMRRSGAGDKGIDVLVSDQRGNYIVYQCKKYRNKFSLSDTIKEIGKICYYAFKKKITKPTEYYLVAHSGITEDTERFFEAKDKIAETLISKWDECCKEKITSTRKIELTNELKDYIENFNFGKFSYKGITEVLTEHQGTVYFAFRFGDKLTIKRPMDIKTPSEIQNIEHQYILKLYDVYSEYLGVKISSDDELKKIGPEMYAHLQKQRERFFRAENLRVFAKDSMLLESEFEKLKEEIYDTIFDSLFKQGITAYDRLEECLTKSGEVAVTNNLLTKCEIVDSRDRRGICHHLANEKEDVKWKR